MKQKILLILFFILPCCLYAQTQQKIQGKVVDADRQDVAFATVRLLEQDSTFVQGTTTDSIGCFELPFGKKGKYILYVSSIGYESQRQDIELLDPQQEKLYVVLKTDNIRLGEVVIKGKSLVRKDNHLQIVPDRQQVKHAGTGYDLLYNLMLPGIEVDRMSGTVSTFGGNVTLYIDGRKAEYREVQNLRPQDVERIEYFDVPGGKYATDIASINYVTKQYKSGGYVSADARQTLGYRNEDYNLAAKVQRGDVSYTLFGGHAYSKRDAVTRIKNEEFFFPDYAVSREYRTLGGENRNNRQYGQLNILSRKAARMLSGKFSLVRSHTPENSLTGQMEYDGHFSQNHASGDFSRQTGIMPGMELYGNFDLKNNQYIEVTARGSYARNTYRRSYTEDDYASASDNREDLYNLFAGINYGIRLPKQNSLSVQLRTFYMNSSSNYEGSYTDWQHLWNSQTLFYVEYSQRISRFNFQVMPGITALYYHLHGSDRVEQYTPRLTSRLSWQPDKKQQLSLNLLVANAFPNINALNDAIQEIDLLKVKRGNPALRNKRFYQAQLNYSLQLGKVNLQAVGFYLFQQHPIITTYSVADDRLVESFDDCVRSHSANAVLSLSWKATEHLHFKLDGNYMHTDYHGFIRRSLNSYSGSFQANYYWKSLSFRLFGKSTGKMFTPDLATEYQPARYGASASWVCNPWRVEAGTENPFTKHVRFKYRQDTDVYRWTEHLTNRTYQQTGYIKVSYTFDFGRKTSKDWKNVNTFIDSAILKAQ